MATSKEVVETRTLVGKTAANVPLLEADIFRSMGLPQRIARRRKKDHMKEKTTQQPIAGKETPAGMTGAEQ